MFTSARTINVVNGDDLQAKIDAAVGGDVLLLDSGTYGGFRIDQRRFTAESPWSSRRARARPLLLGRNYEGNLARISDSSYVVLDGLTMENSNHPIYCKSVDHLILVNLEVHNTGQEIIHIRGTSRYVDIRNCKLYDSGHHRPQWSEGIYIGTGQPPHECSEYVWIEGNDIHHTANSEGINIKTSCYHITIRGNKVHDMEPGTATQHNEAPSPARRPIWRSAPAKTPTSGSRTTKSTTSASAAGPTASSPRRWARILNNRTASSSGSRSTTSSMARAPSPPGSSATSSATAPPETSPIPRC